MPNLIDNLGNLKRLVERSRQTRRWETTAFSTSGGGTLHVPRQKSRGVPTTGGGEGLSIGTPPIGEIIRLGIHSHLGNGNEPVLFNSVAYRNGFKKVVVPSSQLELPHGAIYGIEGELRWVDGYTGGGVVTLLLDNQPYMTLPGFSSAWTRFAIATEFDAVQGQRLSIFVDHDDTGADHDLAGELVIATKEPLKEVVSGADVLFAYGEAASRPTSVTLQGTDDIAEGDLLVAFLHSAEPSITAPADWNLQTTIGTGDARYQLYWKQAQAGDSSASWTWTATGGTSPDLTMMVGVLIIREGLATGSPFDGINGDFATTGVTSFTLSGITPADGSLLYLVCFTGEAETAHSVSTMGLMGADADGDEDDEVMSAWEDIADGTAQSRTVTWGTPATGGAFLFGIIHE